MHLFARYLTACLVLGLVIAEHGAALANKKETKAPYTYTVVGNADREPLILQAPVNPSFVLMGGGPDVDEGFRYLIRQAGVTPHNGGRFVVIRASGDGAYNPYIFYSNPDSSTSTSPIDGWVGGASLGLSSVETLVVPSVEAANHPEVERIVKRANAVWIAGGDQANYIKFWKGTALERVIQGHLDRKTPLGGTSAGLAVLGQYDFAALNGTVTSSQALGNPYNKYMTLDPTDANGNLTTGGGFIAPSALANTITESHFDERDRMGRLITFMSRLIASNGSAGASTGCMGGVLPAATLARGIGLGVETALLVEHKPSGVFARRVTNTSTTSRSAVYFVSLMQPPTRCLSRQSLEVPVNSIEIRVLEDSNKEVELSNLIQLPMQPLRGVVNGDLMPAAAY